MAPKGGTFFFLLIVACAALAMPRDTMPRKPDLKDMAKKLMMKCQNKGYQVPSMMLLRTVFNESDVPEVDRNADSSNTFLSTFLNILNSATASTNRDLLSRVPMDIPDKMANQMWNCTNLPHMIRLMKNSSEASACYMQAFVAPMSWMTLTTQGENTMDSDDYDTLLWAAKPALQDMPSSKMKLPPKVEGHNMKKMMKTLQEVYDPMCEDQGTRVVKWAKEQIVQNYFNCTMMPPSDGRSITMEHCNASLKWLNMEAMTMMGPYLSSLAPDDVDSSPKEKLCEFFRSARLKSTLSRATRMKPRLRKKFLQRVQECFSGKEEFAEHVDKLGTLACCYYDPPDLTPEFSKKLLSQLDSCDDPRTTQLKKRLVRSIMSNSSSAQSLHELGSSVTLLSPKQLSELPGADLKEVLKYLGPSVQWTQCQLCALVKNQLGNEKCKEVSGEELMALQSVAQGLPSCVLKRVKAQEILKDTEALEDLSMRMRKGQLKAMMQGLRGSVGPSELVQKLFGPLLLSLPLDSLKKANITSLDQVENKMWSRAQAAYLAKKMHDLKQFQYRRLHSILHGLTCKMIDKVADSDTQDMALAIAETPWWLSKVQARCAAQKLFTTLEKKRADYFKTITGNELDQIPTFLLLHLPPSEVKVLPDTVCPVFLAKMEEATLSSLPPRAPSRPALAQRALDCLTSGEDLSKLTTEDLSMLGQLLCELSASQLRLMAPDVVKSSLQAMASCQHIPQDHRADLIQLVNQTLGDPSDWSPETMEMMCPVLLWDDNATSALPNKSWMKDVLYFLKPRLFHTSNALKKKLFDLTTTTSNVAHIKGAANLTGNGNYSDNSNTAAPTVELIEELGTNNIYWKAAQLDKMSKDTFLATVETLGAISGYSADQLAVLSQKATEALGPVSQMTESEVMQMGCITQGFSDADLEKLPFSLDAMEEIGHCGWSESQMASVWKGVAKYNNLTAQQLGAADMVALNRFICGLKASEIEQLNREAFRDAVGSMDGIQCSYKVAQQFKKLVVSTVGDPSSWTEAQVSDFGDIMAGLNATELASLDPSVFPFLSHTCVPLIPPDNFAALSVVQLEALGPDNAAMVTTEQKAVLKDEQRAAVERAVTGSRKEPVPSTGQSGAPSLSVEGIQAFMKPLLFLLMGFLLL